MSRRRTRASGLAVWMAVGAVALAAISSCGSSNGAADTDPSTTSTSVATTTTLSAEDRAAAELEAMSPEERAAFILLNNPPAFPPPLQPTPDPGTPPVPLEVVRLGPDREPVLGPDGVPQVFTVHLDHLGQLVTDESGEVAIEGEGSIVEDDDGRPILQTIRRGPDGEPERFFDVVRLDRLPSPPSLNPVLVLGDSVVLGAEANFPDALAGWDVAVDAQESRLAGRAPEVVEARRGDVKRAAVVMLGHNSGAGESHEVSIRAVLDALDGVERVVWVTAAEWGPGQIEFNEAVRRVADESPQMYVADWALYNAAYAEYTYDGLHLTPEGRQILVDLVAGYLGPPPETS